LDKAENMFNKLKKPKKDKNVQAVSPETPPSYEQQATTTPMEQVTLDAEGYSVPVHSDPFERVQTQFGAGLDESPVGKKTLGGIQVEIRDNATQDTAQSSSELTSAIQRMNTLTIAPNSTRRRKPPAPPSIPTPSRDVDAKSFDSSVAESHTSTLGVRYGAAETINVLFRDQVVEKSLISGELSMQGRGAYQVTIVGAEELVANARFATLMDQALNLHLDDDSKMVPVAKYRVPLKSPLPIMIESQWQAHDDRTDVMLTVSVHEAWLDAQWSSIIVVAKLAIDGTPQVQSKPTAHWIEDKQSLYWKVEPSKSQKLLARISLPAKLESIGVTYTVQNRIFSDIQLWSPSPLEAVEQQTKSGRYAFE
jgi:hypothetical protein